LPVGRAPDGVESDPVLRRVYVAVEDSNAVVEISDSPDLPLQAGPNIHQAAAVRQAILLLQQAAVIYCVTDDLDRRRRYTGRPVTALACAGKPSKSARAPRRLAQSRISLLRNISDSRAFQKIIHRRAGVCMRETARR